MGARIDLKIVDKSDGSHELWLINAETKTEHGPYLSWDAMQKMLHKLTRSGADR